MINYFHEQIKDIPNLPGKAEIWSEDIVKYLFHTCHYHTVCNTMLKFNML